MFQYTGGIHLPDIDLWLDARSSKPFGFASHGHTDHIGRHRHLLATPETLRICALRLGRRPTTALSFREPLVIDAVRLTAYHAGHVLGSAMLHVENGAGSLIYTGDFRLKSSRTCPLAEAPPADDLIMECTYGHPRYQFPDREGVIGEFLDLVRTSLARDVTPIVFAYSLGKAQEVTRILTDARLPVMVHDSIFKMNRLYEECGVPLGDYQPWRPELAVGHVLILPPTARYARTLGRKRRRVTMQLTGWALDAGGKYRLGVDHCFPFSDHADYGELLELVERVNPKRVYCTHGPEDFVGRLQALGCDARRLEKPVHQPVMF